MSFSSAVLPIAVASALAFTGFVLVAISSKAFDAKYGKMRTEKRVKPVWLQQFKTHPIILYVPAVISFILIGGIAFASRYEAFRSAIGQIAASLGLW